MIGVEDLRALDVFASLGDELLVHVAERAADVQARSGEYLVHEGEVPAFYVLLRGTLEVTQRLRDLERVLATLDESGDYFGELPILLGTTTFANLRAAGAARVLRLDAQEMLLLVQNAPAFAAAVAGRRFDARSHAVRDFLARNHVPFEYVDGGGTVAASAVVLASGVAWRTLGIPNVDRFLGAGVYYGAARTEAMTTRGHDVFLVGAGNSAGQAAMFFARYARSVTLVARGGTLSSSMSDYLIRELETKDNVRTLLRSELVDAGGDGHLASVTVADRATGRSREYETPATFVFIGADAQTRWLPPAIVRDELGFVLAGMRMRALR